MHRETEERQWTTQTASSLVAVVVRRCTEERKSTGLDSYDYYFVLDAMLDRQPVERTTWADVVDESTKYNNVSQFARWWTSQLSLTVLAVCLLYTSDAADE